MLSAAPFTARRLLPVPGFALRLAFGEMAEATILAERAGSAGSSERRGLRLRIS